MPTVKFKSTPLGRGFLGCRAKNDRLFEILKREGPIRVGGLQARLSIFHQVQMPGHGENPWHTHACYEWSIVRSGEIAYQVDGAPRRFGPSEAFFLPPQRRHHWEAGPRGAIIDGFLLNLAPLDASGREFLSALPTLAAKARYRLKLPASVMGALREIDGELRDENPFCDDQVALLVRGIFIGLFRHLFPGQMARGAQRSTIPERPDRGRHLFLLAKKRIDGDKGAPLRLGEIAAGLGVSPRYVNLLFQKNVGMPCGHYILEQRLWEAFNLLKAHPEWKIREVAHACGFSDPLHFTRAFTKKFHASPKRVRSSIYM